MADTTIFGIDSTVIGFCVNIGIAAGTLILAFFIYKSIKSLKATLESLKLQFEIVKKDLEKKQLDPNKAKIIDYLQFVLNPLRHEVDLELNKINEKLILWKSKQIWRPYLLFTPVDPCEFFEEEILHTRLGPLLFEIETHSQKFKAYRQERHYIYIYISNLVSDLYQEIKKQEIDNVIDELIKKRYSPYKEVFQADESGPEVILEMVNFCDYLQDIPESCSMPLDAFKAMIINIGITKNLLQQVVSDDIHEKLVIREFSAYEDYFKTIFNSPPFEKYPDVFKSLINDLKNADNNLITEIDEIKRNYRNKYHLTDDEYWKVSGINQSTCEES